MLNYYPPSGGQGISLGLARQYRCAFGARIGWGGHTHPPLHRASAPKTLDVRLSSRGVSVRFVFVRLLVLYLATGLIDLPLRLDFLPRLLEPPSALQLPPPAVCISLQILRT